MNRGTRPPTLRNLGQALFLFTIVMLIMIVLWNITAITD